MCRWDLLVIRLRREKVSRPVSDRTRRKLFYSHARLIWQSFRRCSNTKYTGRFRITEQQHQHLSRPKLDNKLTRPMRDAGGHYMTELPQFVEWAACSDLRVFLGVTGSLRWMVVPRPRRASMLNSAPITAARSRIPVRPRPFV